MNLKGDDIGAVRFAAPWVGGRDEVGDGELIRRGSGSAAQSSCGCCGKEGELHHC